MRTGLCCCPVAYTAAMTLWTPRDPLLPGHELNGNGALALGEKADNPASIIDRSVTQTQDAGGVGIVGASFLMWAMATQADGFTQWGLNPKMRDRELRAFWPTESLLASAIATISARNAAMEWKVSGSTLTAEAGQAMLNNANFGGGWQEFITQLSLDLYTTDLGAFVEFIREADRPDAPVIGIAHLDSLRCYPTGNPEFPVVYEDTKGKFHRMPWYSVVQLLEMAAPVSPAFAGFFFKVQYSAVTRVLRAAQVMKSIMIYKDEKVSGRFQRAIHLISGVSERSVQDALERSALMADQRGLQRYIQPAMVASVDPNAAIKHDTMEMASLPDGWSEKESADLYILALAMGLLTDYQEFAPLPGGGLGTSAQSEVLNQKSRGKGPGLFRALISRLMNMNGALPANALFEWDEQDAEADKLDADIRNVRAEARGKRIVSGEIDDQTARDIALREGDLTEDEYNAANERAEQRKAEEADAQAAQMAQLQAAQGGEVEGEDGNSTGGDAQREGEDGNRGERSISALPSSSEWDDLFGERAAGPVPFGNLISGRLHRAYSTAADDAHSLGYFGDTDERKVVGQAIGPALALFEEALREGGVWDVMIDPEDADRIVNASLGLLAGERAITPPESPIAEDRLDYEDEVGVEVARALSAARRAVTARLRAED